MMCFLHALLLLAACQTSLSTVQPGLLINTTNGPIHGVVDEKVDVNIWFQVPFAQPPTGNLRFAPPVPATPWIEKRMATKAAPGCPQMCLTKRVFFGVEDCLYLSVFRPRNVSLDEKLPVLFWMFGGGFIFGDSEEFGWYDGRRLAANRRVVVVSTNYRVANLGFLALPSLLREHGTVGNWALLDQQLAMRWVQSNIGSFGGDNKRVMIFGESAGAISVTTHMSMPSSKGLFHSAIAESSIAGGSVAFTPLDKSFAAGELFASDVGCSNTTGETEQLACLRRLPLSSVMAPMFDYVFKNWREFGSRSLPGAWPIMAWWPTIDGILIPVAPIQAVRDPNAFFNDVPLIAGNCHDEGSIMAASMHFFPHFATRKPVTEIVRSWYNTTIADAFVKEYPVQNDPATAFSLFMRDALFVCPTRAWLHAIRHRRQASGSKVPAYYFMFNATMDNDFLHRFLGDHHTSEISYVFDNPISVWSAADKKLSAHMQLYWSQHAANGNPNSDECSHIEGCIDWPEFGESDTYMTFAEKLSIAHGFENWGGKSPAPKCDFWDHWGYNGYDQPDPKEFAGVTTVLV